MNARTGTKKVGSVIV